ncbi:MAG: M3 family oligoendopeptidase [Anaerorhabdus sp.]|uniref:M3 family oligoendopeptidase n=1 Tax=Anaerorhabdus sp. TaxID=1872524 RepID=UPI003A86F814
MKFKEFKYERLDYDQVKGQLDTLQNELKECSDVNSFMEIFDKINQIRSHVQTMASLSSTRYSINTADEFYEKENDYWDEISPMYASTNSDLYKIILNHKLRNELEGRIPSAFFKLAECAIKSFDEKIISDMQEENKLISRQAKIYAGAKIDFEGKIYNLSSIGVKTTDKDRKTRESAIQAKMKWFEENEEEIDEIFDQMVKVRTTMAHKLGYSSFTELGYLRMSRLDYNADMVANYRKQVLNFIVPAAKELYDKQRERLGYKELRYFDEKIEFLSGNPKPKGTTEELIQAANKMYHELSNETGEFFDVMVEQELFDLESKPNKQGGGYCTDFPDYKVPFIFSNFNGTSGDVDVLTHEAGHAFQSYMSQKTITIPECMFPTMESAEIHSMSMEFFAHPWMPYFFKEETDKYYYLHVADAMKFVPYGVLVDHFQHEIYANPNCTKDERKKMWRDLEKKYLPHKDYGGCDMLEKGCWWYQQGHIFQSPFYYIDYTLAQVCALQFWVRMINKDEKAWSDYVHLCGLGGTKTFLELVKEAGLKSPFEDGTIEPVVATVKEYLSSIDTKTL